MTKVNFKTESIGNESDTESRKSNTSKFKIVDPSLWISNIGLSIKNIKKEHIYWQNLAQNKSKKKSFKLNPDIYGSYEC